MSLIQKIGGGQKPLRHTNNHSPHTKHKHKHPINQHTPTKTKSTGFTMVELIITVVILAIITAVTIGGLSTYIKKSRINTDINNASAIKKALSTLQIDKDIINSFDSLQSNNKIGIQWQDAQQIQGGHFTSEGNNARVDENIPPLFIDKIGELLPEGLPASKVEKPFYITIGKTEDNEIIIDSFNEIEIDGSLSSEAGTGGNSSRLPTIVVSHTHTYQTTITLEETCTTPGEKTYSCTKCDKVYTEKIPASHSYSTEFTVDTEPTCTVEGSKSKHCTRSGCTAQTDITTIEKVAHTPTNGGTAAAHTKCSVCNTTLSSTHNYNKTTQTAATCTTKGTSKYTCSCGYSYTSQDIPATGLHTYVNNTCTGCGDTQYVKLTFGTTYSFGGYEWIVAETNEKYVTLQSKGVTSGYWPGYTMSKFGNGSFYYSNIDGQDISGYNTRMSNLYNSIKATEYTSAPYGKGLFLIPYPAPYVYYRPALRAAAVNYSSFGAYYSSAWFGTASGSYAFCFNQGGNEGNCNQDISLVIAPAFNLDTSKVSLSGSSLIVK